MPYDSIIIGAGLSGLTSALLLARSGRKVLVLEQHAQPAPVVRGFSRAGLYFDSGFHCAGGLGEASPFRPLLRHLGLEEALEFFPFDAAGADVLQIGKSGERYSLPVGFAALRAKLIELFPQARLEIAEHLDGIAAKWCHFPYLNLETDLADFSMETVHGRSLQDQLQKFSRWPKLQSLLSMHSMLYGVSPEVAPATLNAQVAGSYYHSVHGIVGGGRSLVDALLDLLSRAGAEVRCRAKVDLLLSSVGSVSGVRLTTGEELSAPEVIATLNPALLPQLLPSSGGLRPAYLKRLKNLRQTGSAYILFARSPKPLGFLQRRNLFVLPKAGIFRLALDQPLEQRPFYLTVADQGREEQGQVEKKGGGVIAIMPASYAEVAAWQTPELRRSADYRAQKEQLGRRLMGILAENCPALADLELLELATPLTLRDYSCAPEGAIYGVGRFIGQYNPQPLTRLSGLYLSGQAIAAPGLMGAVISSYLTCGSILGHEHLRNELRACR